MRYRTWLLSGLMLASPAQALDIEPITIRSAQGQPLLAEIPLEATPDELRGLRAGLAPAVVFARVGLSRPQGAVNDLRFTVVEGPGRAVVRITTDKPVTETFFTFLIQLEWSSGRMIREFSVALQDPTSMPVAKLPAIVAPDPAPAAAIPIASPAPVEAATPAPIPLAEPSPAPPPPAPAPAEALPENTAEPVAAIPLRPRSPPAAPARAPEVRRPVAKTPARPPANVARPAPPPPVEAKKPAPPPRPAAASRGGRQYGPVKPGEALSRIASGIDDDGASHEQALAALLIANPDAFIGGNINRLKRGAVLRLPSPSELASIQASHARRLVHLQIRAWEQGPGTVADAEMAEALAAVEVDMATVAASAPAPAADAGRLEITPAGPPRPSEAPPDVGPAGTSVSHAAGPQVEAIASREAEIEHLRRRVAELEGSNDEMKQVIAIQDQALATAQERLADAGGEPPASARARWLWAAVAGLVLAGLVLAGLAFARKYRRDGAAGGATGITGGRWPRWHRP